MKHPLHNPEAYSKLSNEEKNKLWRLYQAEQEEETERLREELENKDAPELPE